MISFLFMIYAYIYGKWKESFLEFSNRSFWKFGFHCYYTNIIAEDNIKNHYSNNLSTVITLLVIFYNNMITKFWMQWYAITSWNMKTDRQIPQLQIP